MITQKTKKYRCSKMGNESSLPALSQEINVQNTTKAFIRDYEGLLLVLEKGKIAIRTESKIFIQMKQKQMFLLLSWRMIAFMRSFCLHSAAGSGNSSIKRRVKICSITTMLFVFAIFLSEMRGLAAVLNGI